MFTVVGCMTVHIQCMSCSVQSNHHPTSFQHCPLSPDPFKKGFTIKVDLNGSLQSIVYHRGKVPVSDHFVCSPFSHFQSWTFPQIIHKFATNHGMCKYPNNIRFFIIKFRFQPPKYLTQICFLQISEHLNCMIKAFECHKIQYFHVDGFQYPDCAK